MPPNRSRNSHAFENMVEHVFLGELLQEMWIGRNQVLEVAKADIDAWGYDVVLSTNSATRYVQLKTSVPIDVNIRLFEKEGACVVAAIPEQSADRLDLRYRLWEPTVKVTKGLPLSKRSVYRRGKTVLEDREGHRRVGASKFKKAMSISDLAKILFPK